MKNKLLFIFVSAYLGISVSQAEPLNRNTIELTPSQMDSVVAGISSSIDVSGYGSSDFFVYGESGTYSEANDNFSGSVGFVGFIAPGGTATTDATTAADGDYTYELNIQPSIPFGQVQGAAVFSFNLW